MTHLYGQLILGLPFTCFKMCQNVQTSTWGKMKCKIHSKIIHKIQILIHFILRAECNFTVLTSAVCPVFRRKPEPCWGRITSHTWADEGAVCVVAFRKWSTSTSIHTLINICNSNNSWAHLHYYRVSYCIYSSSWHSYIFLFFKSM